MRQSFLYLIRETYKDLRTSAKMGRRHRHHNKKTNQTPQPYRNERNYATTPKENELFKKFYSGLGLMPAEEVEDFYNQMKEPLPVTFRITGYKSQAKELMKIIRNQFFDSLIGKTPESVSSSSTNGATATTTATSSDGDAGGVAASEAAPASAGADAGDGMSSGLQGEKDEGAPKGLTADAIKPPKCLSWYPDQLAWQIDLSRKDVRSLDVLSKLHQFLVSETETGNISRQEAVSMIPPLVLDVQSNSRVLDMCAAPGSKTAQLIEYLHKDENSVPEGVVVANDKENKRCYLMVHQVKRLASPCCMIVNHDAAFFPKLRISTDEGKPEHMLFDRVLADVPCSGDGTMRKNIDIWKKWHPAMGNSLHGLQLKILKRGLELLEVGGRLVYSTCSMQPVEDEAIIAEMLRKCEGSVKLVDISSCLPGFKSVPGLSNWKLMTRQGEWIEDQASVPERFRQSFTPSMFPPTPQEAADFNLHLCHRILPHHQDTGGFFVAAMEKVGHLPWSKEARSEREAAIQSSAAATEPSTPADQPTAPADQPTAPADKPTAPADQPTAPADQPTAPADQPTAPADQPMAPADQPTAPADQPTAAPSEAPEDSSNSGSASTATVSQNRGSNSAESSNPRKRKAETNEGPPPKKMELKGYKEDPFLFLSPDDPVYPAIRKFYGLTDNFPVDQLLYRSETGVKRALYFVNKVTRQIVTCNEGRVRFINMGVKFVSRSPSPLVPDCDFRITQECLGSLRDLLTKRMVPVTRNDAIIIFKEENPFLDKMDQATQKIMQDICPGSVVFLYKPTESEPEPACELAFCGWRGKMSVRCFVPRFERAHGLRLFGQDLSQIQAEVARIKAERRAKLAEETSSSTSAATTTTTAEGEKTPAKNTEVEELLTAQGEGEESMKCGGEEEVLKEDEEEAKDDSEALKE